MRNASIFLMGLVLALGFVPRDFAGDTKAEAKAGLKPVAATADIPFNDYDIDAEQQIFALANLDRQHAGLAPLKFDSGLSKAARVHALAMYDARQLSHQFDGEPSLAQRLAAVTRLQLDREGENVALDYDPANAEQHLMLSPPHRANLLNPNYNVIGLGVVRSGGRLYVVQDFGHAVAGYSTDEMKDGVASAVSALRHGAHKKTLPRQELASLDDAACSMAKADRMGTQPVRELAKRYNVLTFTSLDPKILPGSATSVVNGPNLRSFSVGACYARTDTYPTGVYWLVLTLD